MGCGCHSTKAVQPIRQAVSNRRTTRVSISEPIIRNVYNTSSGASSRGRKIIRRTVSH